MRYKLTDQNSRTRGDFQWTPGEWRTAKGKGNEPCTNGVIHYYDSPRLAVLFNPIHAVIEAPMLWDCETDQELGHDGLKGWCKRARIIYQLPLPALSNEQKVEFGIRCAMLVYFEKSWVDWANNWLSGQNRSAKAAFDAANDAGDAATFATLSYYNAANAKAAAKAAYAAKAATIVGYAASTATFVAFAAKAVADAANAATFVGLRLKFISIAAAL